jgi:hypothetical protein
MYYCYEIQLRVEMYLFFSTSFNGPEKKSELFTTNYFFMILVGRPEGRRQIGRPRRRWEDNIKMDLQDGDGGMNWIELAQDRDRWPAVVNAVMNLRVP